MAITSTNSNTVTASTTNTDSGNPSGILGKDDFLKLLLVELQNQDPTAPTDTEKILSQTSQLATLESADNTNKALEKLALTLGSSQQFSTIAAIGKTARLGSDAIAHDKDSNAIFEVYFSKDVEQGTIEITDGDGNIVSTLETGKNVAGVVQFTWDGLDGNGVSTDSGIYHVNANYTDTNGDAQTTSLGVYPIDAVRFEDGKTLVKLGSNFVPLENVKEVF